MPSLLDAAIFLWPRLRGRRHGRHRFVAAIALVCVVVLAAACVVGPGGGFESLSGSGGQGSTGGITSGQDSSGSTGFPPEPACNFDLGANPLGEAACSDDIDCCALPTAPSPFGCPSAQYPNNWSCESAVCRQRSNPQADVGCSVADDCRFPGFACLEINDVHHCVAPCTQTSDCQGEHNMPDSTCETVDGQTFCMQQP